MNTLAQISTTVAYSPFDLTDILSEIAGSEAMTEQSKRVASVSTLLDVKAAVAEASRIV